MSWNPRNVVLAGKAGAVFKDKGQLEQVKYEKLFDPSGSSLSPTQARLPGTPTATHWDIGFRLESAETFIRTTLRYPEFCFGWKHIVDLRLTEETAEYDTDGMTLQQFFHLHFDKYGFYDWMEKQLIGKLTKPSRYWKS